MKLLLLASAVALVCVSPAKAVTYALENVSYNRAAQIWNLLPAPDISLTITPAAVARGSFDFHAATGPLQVWGDTADLVAFLIGSTTLGPSGYGVLYSHLDIALDFGADGNVMTGSIDWLGSGTEFNLSGTAARFGGTFSLSDSSSCGMNSNPVYDCRMTGVMVDPPDPPNLAVATPEPRTSLLLLPLLVAYAAFASRRRA